jgi:S1-C subfamily serine protease
MEMVRVSKQQGVPVITVDDQVIIGFNQPRLTQALKKDRGAGSRRDSAPRLGTAIADAAAQARKVPGIPEAGAYVGRVRSGSPAERAGLRPGDVITLLAGHPVARAEDVHRLVPQLPTGRDLSLTYVRRGQEHDVLIRL